MRDYKLNSEQLFYTENIKQRCRKNIDNLTEHDYDRDFRSIIIQSPNFELDGSIHEIDFRCYFNEEDSCHDFYNAFHRHEDNV